MIDVDYRAMYLKVRDELAELQQRHWVGLTDEEILECLGPEAARIPPGWSKLTDAIEAKLKEKNK